jgi:hypothetical protein
VIGAWCRQPAAPRLGAAKLAENESAETAKGTSDGAGLYAEVEGREPALAWIDVKCAQGSAQPKLE